MSEAPPELDIIELIKGCVRLLNHEQLGKLTQLFAALIVARNSVVIDTDTVVTAKVIAIARNDFPEESRNKFTEMVGKAPGRISQIHSILGQVTSLMGADSEANRNDQDKRVVWVDFVAKDLSVARGVADGEVIEGIKRLLGSSKRDSAFPEKHLFLLAAGLLGSGFNSRAISAKLKDLWSLPDGEKPLSNVASVKDECVNKGWIKVVSGTELGQHGFFNLDDSGWKEIDKLILTGKCCVRA
jgi:hypothetical protein